MSDDPLDNFKVLKEVKIVTEREMNKTFKVVLWIILGVTAMTVSYFIGGAMMYVPQ